MTNQDKLLVVSVDAMQGDDLPFARTLPSFGRILERAAVAEIEAVFPTLTYPNHVAQLTGCSPATSGVFNNLQFQPGRGDRSEWFWDAGLVRVPTLLDAARAAGLRTAAVQWPATAGADVDTLVPEIWDWQTWGSVEAMYRGTASSGAVEKYVLRHLDKIQWEPKRKFNEFACSIAEEILRDERPDVMFLHLVEVDSARHADGPYGPHVEDALRKVDGWLGRLLSALEAAGTAERTNIVLVSDHGHLETVQHTNLNTIFRERGFLRVDEAGELVDFDVFCLGAGLSGQLFLADGISAERRAEVEALLAEVEATPEYRIERIWTAEDARARYGLDGPFTWVVESEPGVIVGMKWDRRPVVRKGDEDFVGYLGNHGHAPRHGGQPVFLAAGPAFVAGADAGRRSMLDEAPTFAAVLGLELPDAEGVAMSELLSPDVKPVVGATAT